MRGSVGGMRGNVQATGHAGVGLDVRPSQRGVGSSAARPDGYAKAQGGFTFSSDMQMDEMLWASTLRSPHPYARIIGIDASVASTMPGVQAIITHEDVPGESHFGLVTRDQPVFASDIVRYHGEPIAAVAADHPALARRAAQAIKVLYESLDPLVDPRTARMAPPIHPDGNVFRHLPVRRGDQDVAGEVIVEGYYEIGMQDQAFMGPEAALARPFGDRGVEIHVATQDLHADRGQIAACLGVSEDEVLLLMAGIGGAFGAREDLSLQIHLALLALRTGRPVKMVYSRTDSFLGHVHRHPAQIWLSHHATRAGELVKVEGTIVVDGGAYASTSALVLPNATCFLAGPYRVATVDLQGWAVRTNNPPCGAMRGFGTVQACYGAESQMDKLAAALSMDPLALRRLNAVVPGDAFTTGQVFGSSTPARECLDALAGMDMPPTRRPIHPAIRPGGVGNTTLEKNIRRGVGYALGFKNFMFGEGFDDYSTARVRLELGTDLRPIATVFSAAAEVGQGFVTIAQQVVRTELGIEQVYVAPADSQMGAAGSSSASRQAYMSGGAVQRACREVTVELQRRLAQTPGTWRGAAKDGTERLDLPHIIPPELMRELLGEPVDRTAEFHHTPTQQLDSDGQGDAYVAFAFVAHRATVDVDVDLGLVRVVEVATAQDVGHALNPLQVIGQIEGGIAQGLGLALMEELQTRQGQVLNPSFTDYLIPTCVDMPDIAASLVEVPEAGAPFGAKGVGEPPVISSTPAIVNAIRAATGLPLERIPVRPPDLLDQRLRAAAHSGVQSRGGPRFPI